MSDDVERVAKAIYDTQGFRRPWASAPEWQENWRIAARAALAEILKAPVVIDYAYERDRATRMMARQSGEKLPPVHMEPDLAMEAAYQARLVESLNARKDSE